jgi:hypothetical protein
MKDRRGEGSRLVWKARQRSTAYASCTLPPDSIYGLPPATATKAISDGINVMVKPLPPGAHRVVIHFEAPIIGGTTDVVYNLAVVARGH